MVQEKKVEMYLMTYIKDTEKEKCLYDGRSMER